MSESPADIAKINAARRGADYVKDGMIVGLGTGSTAAHLVRVLGARVKDGLKFHGVPTSEATLRLARACGIAMLDPDESPPIDLTIDGTDEVDPRFRLIKGGGGALLREKIIAASSADYVIIADEAKPVETLGAFPLPVEVVSFGLALTRRKIEAALRDTGCAAARAAARNDVTGAPFISDGGNMILDCHCGRIPDPDALAETLAHIPGVVEHGLFIGMAKTLIIGSVAGAEVRTAP
jgi:ribose 5-phosphate isomerase A